MVVRHFFDQPPLSPYPVFASLPLGSSLWMVPKVPPKCATIWSSLAEQFRKALFDGFRIPNVMPRKSLLTWHHSNKYNWGAFLENLHCSHFGMKEFCERGSGAAWNNFFSVNKSSFYRTRVRSLGMLVSDSLTHWLTPQLPSSKLDWCDPGVWRCQLKTC